MTPRTVLLVAPGVILGALAVWLRDHRLPLVVAECVAFCFAGQKRVNTCRPWPAPDGGGA